MFRFPFKQVQVPLTTIIRDYRVDRLWNALHICALIASVIVFVFFIRGWSSKAKVISVGNMWISKSSYNFTNEFPPYCGNKSYDYIYDSDFQYNDIRCVEINPKHGLSKGTGFPGSYFVTTLTQSTYFEQRNHNYNTTSGQAGEIEKRAMNFSDTRNHFVLGVEDFLLTAKVFAKVEQKIILRSRIFAYTPSGKLKLLSLTSDMTIKMKVREWLQLFEIDSLDETSAEINEIFSTGTSVGNARYRITGLNLYIGIEAANTVGYFSMPGETFIILYLNVGKSWQRVTFPSQRSEVQGFDKIKDDYGLRFLWEPRESKVYVLSLGGSFISLLDVVIFFTVVKFLGTVIFMNFFGEDSSMWRLSTQRTIEEQVYLSKTVRLSHHKSRAASSRATAQNREEELSYEYFEMKKQGTTPEKKIIQADDDLHKILIQDLSADRKKIESQVSGRASLRIRKSELLPVEMGSKYILSKR